jgi:hypothetical protein
MQLISYVVVRTTQTGRPVFEAGGSAQDHAHDALMLALLSITQNYGEFSKAKYASNVESFSNSFFMPPEQMVNQKDDVKETPGRADKIKISRAGLRKKTTTRINRSMF